MLFFYSSRTTYTTGWDGSPQSGARWFLILKPKRSIHLNVMVSELALNIVASR